MKNFIIRFTAMLVLGASVSMFAAQDDKAKPSAQSASATAQLSQLEDEDRQLEEHEQQLATAMDKLLADLKLQHQRNRERQQLIKQENQQWLQETDRISPGN